MPGREVGVGVWIAGGAPLCEEGTCGLIWLSPGLSQAQSTVIEATNEYTWILL